MILYLKCIFAEVYIFDTKTMNRVTLFLLSLLTIFSVSAKNRIVNNPGYDFKTSGIYDITKIELGKKETRVTLRTTFIPNWWISISKSTYIFDPENGEKFTATGIKGGEFDKQIYMPAKGDSSFVIIFPALDKSVKKIDFYNEDDGKKPLIYGVSLNPESSGKVSGNDVPLNVENWIKEAISTSKRKTSVALNPTEFFNKDTARLVGYIKGYDIRSGLNTGIIYVANELTREDNPTVVQIYPDGRFEATISLNFPKYTYVYFKAQAQNVIQFYVEPGQTLGMVLDWNDFLMSDRLRNARYSFRNVSFLGTLAEINNDLKSVVLKEPDYQSLETQVMTIDPETFKLKESKVLMENLEIIDKAIQKRIFTPEAIAILKSEAMVRNAAFLFDFIDRRKTYSKKDTSNQFLKSPVPNTFYDFLKKMPLNDNSLLITSSFSTFINRFEYCDPFMSPVKSISRGSKPSINFYEYLIDKGVKLTDTELKLKAWQESLNTGKNIDTQSEIFKTMIENMKKFYEKYSTYSPGYKEKYLDKIKTLSDTEYNLIKWQQSDSILENDLGLKPNLVYEIIKIRSLAFLLKSMKKENAREFLTALDNGITNPFLIQEGERIFNKTFPGVAKEAYTLPEGKATEIFKKIIDPFKGKILFIDFWATSCGPCVVGIRNMKATREKYKDNKDFDFIFITSEGGSPKSTYDSFVKDQELKNIFRISDNDHNYLRQLFNFNGIPHYIVIDADGKVLSDDFEMHNFEFELTKILKNKKIM